MADLRLTDKLTGTATRTSGTNSISITVATTDWTKSILRISMRGGDGAPQTSAIRYYPSSSTTVVVDNVTTDTDNLDVGYDIMRFDTGILTQYVQMTGGDGVDDGDTFSFGTAIDQSTAFIVACGMSNSGTGFGSDDNVRWTFNSNTEVLANITTNDADNAAVCVVDIDNAAVQVVTTTGTTTTATSLTGTISTAVTTTETLLFSSFETDIASGSGFDDMFYTHALTSTTGITYDRFGTASHTCVITTFVVECADFTVAHGSHDQASGTADDSATITSVDTDLTYVEAGGTANGWVHGLTDYNNSDWNSHGQVVTLASSTSVNFRRDFGGSAGNGDMTTKFQVVTFVEALTNIESTGVLQAEVLGAADNTVVLQAEVIGFVENAGTLQAEVLGVAESTGTLHVEFLGAVDTTGALQVEIVGTTEATGILQTEFLGAAEATGALQAEVLGVADATGTLQVEILGGVDSTGILQIEILGPAGVVEATLIAQVEVIGHVEGTGVLQVELLGPVEATGNLQVEALGSSESTAILQIEILGAPGVVEATLIAQVEVVGFVESTGVLQVELLGPVEATGILQAELLGVAERTAVLQVEIYGELVVEAGDILSGAIDAFTIELLTDPITYFPGGVGAGVARRAVVERGVVRPLDFVSGRAIGHEVEFWIANHATIGMAEVRPGKDAVELVLVEGEGPVRCLVTEIVSSDEGAWHLLAQR